MSDALLEATGLTGGYDAVIVIRDISVAAERGVVTALIGSNGAGKSTILRTLSGLLPVRAGTIRFEGDDITRLSADQRVDRGIVMVPEGRLIFPQMTVDENLRIGAFAPRGRRVAAKTLDTVYAMFPRLAERRGQAGGTLSGGEQQMLALGRGLMARPTVLLLDEPTLGLAPLMADAIFATVERFRDEGLTILIAEQDVGRTLSLANTAHVVENGHIVTSGRGDALLADDSVKRAYLGL